jgi:predicted unusual protein kinase regulating ubiquinone biosynthesis (AarF/ABC1/UbiB family)
LHRNLTRTGVGTREPQLASVPTGMWTRSQTLLSLTAGIAKHELKHQMRTRWGEAEATGISELRARIAQAKLLAENLGRLKGAFMKAGQLLSIDASDFLPPEAIEILSRLQGQAEPIDFAVIRSVLEDELGEEALRQFTRFERGPVASASIGQVHRAQAFGADLAVKIQYPGIAASIDADIALLEGLARSWLSLTRRGIELAPAFDELKTIATS